MSGNLLDCGAVDFDLSSDQEALRDAAGVEDRRPNANMDPYQVTAVITETVCSDAAAS